MFAQAAESHSVDQVFYVRHVDGLVLKNVKISLDTEDALKTLPGPGLCYRHQRPIYHIIAL